ncbi:MAG: glycosyltransferase family 2 protein [Firmicutes bacterium]|nr:glycosyltransferase family 2 protein [Bacillota bacterium]
MNIEAIVLHANTPQQTRAAVASLAASRLPAGDTLGITLVANGGQDPTVAALQQAVPWLRVLALTPPASFAAANNRAIVAALGRGADWVFLLNSDATVAPDCLARLLAAAGPDPRAGAAGPVVLEAHRPARIQTAGITLDLRTGRHRHCHAGQPVAALPEHAPMAVPAVSGCAMLLRRAALEAVGLFDERLGWYFEDTDWCLRAWRAGYRVLVVPGARAWHEGAASFGGEANPRRIYYSTRNHLRTVQRFARLAGHAPLLVGLALASTALQNLLFLLAHPHLRRAALVQAWACGVRDFLRDRAS